MIPLKESLNIVVVAEEMKKETPGTTRFYWLCAMGRAILQEPPALLLRPDKTWDTKQPHRRMLSPGLNMDNLYETPTKKEHRRQAWRE